MDADKKQSYIRQAVKYLTEGFVIAICAYFIPVFFKNSLRKPTLSEIFNIALVASISVFLLDNFSQHTAVGARFGAGFNIGQKF
jgi:hypothetical protein